MAEFIPVRGLCSKKKSTKYNNLMPAKMPFLFILIRTQAFPAQIYWYRGLWNCYCQCTEVWVQRKDFLMHTSIFTWPVGAIMFQTTLILQRLWDWFLPRHWGSCQKLSLIQKLKTSLCLLGKQPTWSQQKQVYCILSFPAWWRCKCAICSHSPAEWVDELFHIITKWLRLEGTSGAHLGPTLCSSRAI